MVVYSSHEGARGVILKWTVYIKFITNNETQTAESIITLRHSKTNRLINAKQMGKK